MARLQLTVPRRYRTERALVFIDESGRFQPAIAGGAPESALVAAVAFRETPMNCARIEHVVAALRSRHGPRVKASGLSRRDLAEVGALIAEYGYIAVSGVEYDAADDHPNSCREALDALDDALASAALRITPTPSALHGLTRTRSQLKRVRSPNLMAYTVQLVSLFQQIARWFRRNGIHPVLHATLDERLRPHDEDLLRFLPRFGVAATFDDVYGQRLGALWSDADVGEAVVSTDDECAGLVLADVVAYAYGRVEREADPDGMFAAWIAACHRDCD